MAARFGLAGAVSAVALAGCDPAAGYTREGVLEAPPDLDCVRRVLPQVEGVASVDERSTSSTGYAIIGPVTTEATDFFYRGPPDSNVVGTFRFIDNSSGSHVRFTNGYSTLTGYFRRETLDASIPVALAVEERLARVCGLRTVRPVKENCMGWGIKCDGRDAIATK